MSFLPFIFKKDIRRLKGWLGLWGAFLFIQFVIEIMSLNWITENTSLDVSVHILMKVIRAAVFVLPVILIPFLIQEDSPVNENSFWMTRPISGMSLLLTKMCFIGVFFVLLPLLSELLILGIGGLDAGMILIAVPEIMIEQFIIIIPLMVIASFTENINKYLFFVFMFIAALMGFSLLGGKLNEFLAVMFFKQNSLYSPRDLMIPEIVLFIYGVMTLMIQFSFRSKNYIGFALVMMTCLSPHFSPGLAKDTHGIPQRIATPIKFHVRTDLNHVFINDALRHQKAQERQKTIWVKQTVEGLPGSHFAILKYLENIEMVYPQGEILRSYPIHVEGKDFIDNQQFRIPLQGVLDQGVLVNPYIERFSSKEIFRLDEGDFQKVKDQVGRYQAHAVYDVYRYQYQTELPLNAGHTTRIGSQQLSVYDVLKTPTGVSIYVVQKDVDLIFSSQEAKLNSTPDYRQVYLLYNAKRKQAFLPEIVEKPFIYSNRMLGRRRLSLHVQRLDFTHVNGRNEGLPKINDQWLKDAVLMRIDAKEIGRQVKDIRFENFYLPGKSMD